MTWRTAPPLLLAACGLLAGCASGPPSAPPEVEAAAPDDLPPEPGSAEWWAEGAGRAADATWRATAGAARGVGRGLGAAYQGVTNGFAEPEAGSDFGTYPQEHALEVRKHFERVLRTPKSASYRFGKPVLGYMTEGILQGGDVTWRGYLVDVEVQLEASALAGRRRPRPYVVRMRDGEVIEVHKGSDQPFLHRK